MNIETMAAIADQNIFIAEGSLKDFRDAHRSLFLQNGMKEVIQDSYKFTNMTSFFEDLDLNNETSSDIPDYSSNIPTVTFVNGKFERSDLLPAGVNLRDINFNDVSKTLSNSNALSSFHHAHFGQGILIEIGKDQRVTSPIRIIHLFTKETINTPTNLIIVGSHAQLTIFEETRVADHLSHAQVAETYIMASPGSQVEHISLDIENNHGVNHTSLIAEIEKDATFRSIILTASGKLNRKNLIINLNSPGAHGESYSLYLANEEEQSDIYTEINHKSADTTSDQVAKGILDGNSKGIFTGKIHIFPKAQRVSSGQLNKNLLLSKKAQAHSQPQLEIFADDVKCSHGSTTGQLSDDEVFYFEARGIPQDRARNLLALGFAMEIVQKIQSKESLNYVTKIIKEKLAEKFSLGKGL